MNIDDCISAAEAANIIGVTRRQVGLLCREGKLPGARKIGPNWVIPRASAEGYTPGPQGFAAHPENIKRQAGD